MPNKVYFLFFNSIYYITSIYSILNCVIADYDIKMLYCNFHRYKIQLLIIDDTGSAIVTVFDRDCTKFLGISADQLRKSVPLVYMFSQYYDCVIFLKKFF